MLDAFLWCEYSFRELVKLTKYDEHITLQQPVLNIVQKFYLKVPNNIIAVKKSETYGTIIFELEHGKLLVLNNKDLYETKWFFVPKNNEGKLLLQWGET